MKNWIYAVLCVVFPAVWGLVMARLTGTIQSSFARRRSPQSPEPNVPHSFDYYI